MSDFDKVILFGKKSMSDVLKDIYDNTKKKEKDIQTSLDQFTGLIQNVGDALQLAPLMQKYFEISIQNNEHLIKMIQVVQKAVARVNEDPEGKKELTKEEKAAIIETYKDVFNIKSPN